MAARDLRTRRLRHRSDERGIALVMALGILLVLAISMTVALGYATSNSSESSSANAREKAFHLAEAGVSTAYSMLAQAGNPLDPNTLAGGSRTLEDGTSSYSGSLSGQTWTITGTGTVPNPSGAGTVKRAVSQQVTVTTQGTAWRFLFSDSASACTDIKNNATIAAPLYVRGDLCLGNNSVLTGSPLEVLGTVTMGNGSSAGTVGTPLGEAHIKTGCVKSGNPHLCTWADGIYANTIDANPESIPKPTVDLPYWYENAAPGPNRPCTTGSVPGGFDNDSALNASRAAFALGSGASFDCRVTDAAGNIIGRISWAPGAPGTLTVAGTIFFDGDVNLGNLVYQGRATIYSSGVITMSNASFCGIPGCGASWNPDVNAILLVAGSSTDPVGFDIQNNSVYQGAAYVVTGYSLKNNNANWGPVVADTIDIKNNSGAFIPLNFLPPGAPGIDGTIKPVSGTWGG